MRYLLHMALMIVTLLVATAAATALVKPGEGEVEPSPDGGTQGQDEAGAKETGVVEESADLAADAGVPGSADAGPGAETGMADAPMAPDSKAAGPEDAGAEGDSPALVPSVKKKWEGIKPHWRNDPSVPRRPGSYLGGGIGYLQTHAWYTPDEEEFDEELYMGPVHAMQLFIRVGDAFAEWFAVGFQIDMMSDAGSSFGGVGLLLDVTFYPWRGLGIRPSVGLGFAYVQGSEEWEFGYGGPADLSLTLTYEIRLTRSITLGPVAQVFWIPAEDFDGLFMMFGLELIKWFETPEG